MRIRIYTGSRFSDGGIALTQALRDAGHNALMIRRENSRYVPRADDIIINWGSRRPFDIGQATLVNNFNSVGNTVNKKKAYELFVEHEVKVPQAWFSAEDVDISACPYGIITRSTVTGHGGAGTHWISQSDAECFRRDEVDGTDGDGDEIVMWQKYIAKNAEYRVHVFGDEVVDIQKKRKRTESQDNANSYIRNLAGGWVYCRENVSLSDENKRLAVTAVRSLGLDFGAVDLITTSRGVGFVLEVNSAPGLTGQTLTNYVNSIITHFSEN